MHRIYHLRSQLMPYIYSSVRQCHTDMLPLNRGMYIEYPDEEKAYQYPGQFLFGDLLLGAPITAKGEGEKKIATQEVWLPSGSDQNEKPAGTISIVHQGRLSSADAALYGTNVFHPAHRIDRTLLSGQRRSKQYLYPVRRRRTDPRLPAREVCHHTPQLSEIRGTDDHHCISGRRDL